MPKMANQTAYLSVSDWKALVASGVAVATKSGKVTDYRIDYDSLVSVLEAALIKEADVSSMDELAEYGKAMDYLVHHVCGLPEIDREAPSNDPLWIDPYDGMAKVIGARLRTQFDGAVQKRMIPKGRLLVAKSLRLPRTDPRTGITSPHATQVWAITDSEDVARECLINPEVARLAAATRRKTKNARGRMAAIPDLAPALIAAQDEEMKALAAARTVTYEAAIEGLSDSQRAALDAEILAISGQYAGTMVPAIAAATAMSGDDVSEDTDD